MPTISIIVPVYNVQAYLKRCVDSILKQSFTDFELILVDDGSTDNCPLFCDEYALKDSRVRVIHKENGGVSSARNIGLDIANGRYISFVDSDDWIDSDMYDYLLQGIRETNAQISMCGYRWSSDEGVIEPKDNDGDFVFFSTIKEMWRMKEHVSWSCWCMLYQSELLKKIRFRTDYDVAEDLLFIYEVSLQNPTCARSKKTKYNYYYRSESAIHNRNYHKDYLVVLAYQYISLHEKDSVFKQRMWGDMNAFALEAINRGLSDPLCKDSTLNEIIRLIKADRQFPIIYYPTSSIIIKISFKLYKLCYKLFINR